MCRSLTGPSLAEQARAGRETGGRGVAIMDVVAWYAMATIPCRVA